MTKFMLPSMRNGLIAFLFSLLLITGSFSFGDIAREPAAGEEIVTLAVENMTWAGCVVAVRNSLSSLEGVNEVEVDLDEKTAVVIYETAKVDIAKMTHATTEVGFPSSLKVVAD